MVMQVELQATCSALGYLEGTQYVKEPDCLETVKDLIKFLKREDETCDIRRQLGYAQILQNDLLPILKTYHKDGGLFDTNIRLLVNLTQPAVLCFNNHVPTDKTLRNYYLELETYLQGYKEAFVDEEVFIVLTEKLGDLLKLDWEHRQEEDRMLIERILVLIRNVLHVPPNVDKEQRTDDDASIHDQVIWALHCSGLEDLLLFIASSEEERNLSMHVLEIVSLMFREQTPDMLASAGVSRSMTEKEKDERELEMVREQERAQKRANMMKFSTRHSRFGGTYVVKNMKSISDREVIYHKNQKDVANMTFDENKKPKKKAKNRQPIKDQELVRRSTLSIRLALKEFCVQFLESCYNPLMYAVKDILNHEKAQEHDETYYLWSMRFFMEFCRLHSKQIELVSETMSVPTFHYIQVQLFQYYEMIMMEKKEAKVWGKRVHLALKAYQELLNTLDAMDKSHSSQLRESSKVIKSNIFYMMEYRDIFLTLLRKFNESSQSRTYLKDLVETTHLFLKMLENMTKGNNHFVVQKKKKKGGGRTKKQQAVAEQENQFTQEQLEDMWDEISGELSALFQGRGELPTDVSPFDAASEVDVDHQRADAMIKIQDSLREKQPGQAIALFRAAREVWPERNEFGSPDISPEDEFMALREIFMADIPKPQPTVSMTDEPDYDEIIGQEIEEEEIREVVSTEQEFNFKEFVMKFGHPDIIKPYVTLLGEFQKNSTHTNHCAIKMLHRLAVDMGVPGMMFQASLFRVFQKILLSPMAKTERYKEIGKFATYIVRNFIESAHNNPKIFMELLFWKNHKEASEIVDGYGSYRGKVKQTWTEDQEIELRRLFEECSQVEEGDVIDKIMERITDPSKTRGQIIRELKRQELIESAKDLKRKTGGSRVITWTEEQEYELRDLYEQHKDSKDIIGSILSNLSVKRSKPKVIEKLFALGLVNDRKELYKRRNRKGKAKNPWEEGENDAPILDNWSDDDEGGSSGGEGGKGLPSDESEAEISDSGSDSDSSVSSKASSGSDRKREDDDSDVPVQKDGQPDSQLEKIMIELIDKGYKDQLLWIQRSVKRKADEKERSGSQVSVPIVPLTEENETAMEDEMFTSFLQKIGLSPPANEQEAFWRIPGDITLEDLRDIQEGLTIGEDDKPVSANRLKVKKVKSKGEKKKEKKKSKKKKEKKEKKKLPEKFNALRDMVRKKKEEKDEGRLARRERKRQSLEKKTESAKETTESMSDNEDTGDVNGTNEDVMQETTDFYPKPQEKVHVPTSAKKKRRVKRLMDSDSEEDSDKENSDQLNLANDDDEVDGMDAEAEWQSQSQKRPLDFGDSSDDDEPLLPSKRARRSSEDTTTENAATQRQDEGDSDEDGPSPSRKGKKLAIMSDDSDEDSGVNQTESVPFPATLYSQDPDDSDSDIDDHVPLRRVMQKKSIIESDEDD